MRLINKVKERLRTYNAVSSSKPPRICIELTNRCNLNCPFCLVGQQGVKESVAHDELTRDSGGMDMELCRKIIGDAADFGMREVLLTFQGEPLAFNRKRFIELVQLATQRNLKTIIFTNGLLLDPAYSREIIKAGLGVIRFSVDGITQDVYEINRVGGEFDRVWQNMKDMVKIAKEEKSDIQLIWQFIALRNNEHQIPDARKMAKKIGIEFIVKTFAESVPELVPRNPKLRRKLLPKPCKDIYRSMLVYWNGDIVPCCYDLEGKEILGNVRESTIEDVWNSSKTRDFRNRLSLVPSNPASDPELCKSCLKYTSA